MVFTSLSILASFLYIVKLVMIGHEIETKPKTLKPSNCLEQDSLFFFIVLLRLGWESNDFMSSKFHILANKQKGVFLNLTVFADLLGSYVTDSRFILFPWLQSNSSKGQNNTKYQLKFSRRKNSGEVYAAL